MNRDEKTAVVEEIAAQIGAAEAIFAIDYRGISVPQAAELRSSLRDADASFRVVKNRLTKLAADKAGRDELKPLLEGPTALTFVHGDTATAAKTITNFRREHDVLAFKGGFMEELALDEERFTSIARLPSRDVLNGQFAGVVASPLTGLVRGLGAMISGLALQLQAMADQGLVSGETPTAEETPAEETDAGGSSEDADAPSAGGGAGGTTPEEASATAGGGGSPAPTGPAAEGSEPETSDEQGEQEASDDSSDEQE